MPVSSPYPPAEIPDKDIYGVLFERSTPWPQDKVVFQDADTDKHYTHKSLQETALTFGKGLRSLWDWQKGDVLGFYTPNSIDTPALTFGTLWAGGICSPANPTYTVHELAFQLKDSGAKALVTQAPQLKQAREACAEAGIPEDRIILVGDEKDPEGKAKHFTSVRNMAGTSRYRKARINASKDIAFLVYSSGTTGTPKGVMLSHRNLISNVCQGHAVEGRFLAYEGPGKNQQHTALACLPFFHIYGLTTLIHAPVYSGFKCIVMSRFEINKWCQAVQQYKVEYSNLVPPIIIALAKHPDVSKYDLSSLAMVNSGAAPLSAELQKAVWDRLKLPVKQGYGLSETSPTTHSQTWDEEDWKGKVGSVGKLFPNMEAMYMTSPAEDGSDVAKEVPHGTPGELYVKGPNIFMGYWQRPEETAKCLSEDGWFRTGDVGYQDNEGNFYITDRVKELIKYKGFQVPPAELEGVLLQHPMIEDVAVVGVNSQKQGTEVPRAYVVKKGGMAAVKDTDRQDIIDWIAKKVVNHKRLRGGVKFVDAVPKSPSGKLLRRYLVDLQRPDRALVNPQPLELEPGRAQPGIWRRLPVLDRREEVGERDAVAGQVGDRERGAGGAADQRQRRVVQVERGGAAGTVVAEMRLRHGERGAGTGDRQPVRGQAIDRDVGGIDRRRRAGASDGRRRAGQVDAVAVEAVDRDRARQRTARHVQRMQVQGRDPPGPAAGDHHVVRGAEHAVAGPQHHGAELGRARQRMDRGAGIGEGAGRTHRRADLRGGALQVGLAGADCPDIAATRRDEHQGPGERRSDRHPVHRCVPEEIVPAPV